MRAFLAKTLRHTSEGRRDERSRSRHKNGNRTRQRVRALVRQGTRLLTHSSHNPHQEGHLITGMPIQTALFSTPLCAHTPTRLLPRPSPQSSV